MDRLVGRCTERRASAQIKSGAMPRALDHTTLYGAASELRTVMRADILDREPTFRCAIHRDGGVARPVDLELTFRELLFAADCLPFRQRFLQKKRSTRRSTVKGSRIAPAGAMRLVQRSEAIAEGQLGSPTRFAGDITQ